MTDNNDFSWMDDHTTGPEPNLDFAVGLFCGVCITVAAAVVAMVWGVW